ncbi:hypothetical protein Scep_014483 [Stephania cephalantha]|uniref:HAT C-terminal dimerisation domain-containing protein n=1 Tax=Stephania cephalantha TaxID=152367 RepID=A0AAP0J127_9MAGN
MYHYQRVYDEYKSNVSIVEDEIGQSSDQVADERMKDFVMPFGELKKHLYADDASGNKTEVDRYLMEACEKYEGDFKVLDWWKGNSTQYKVLALIAKDILAILTTTVASESAFDAGGRTFECFWSSLSLKTVEAFIRTKNWLQSKK